jgi:hypothetical protein
MPVPASHARGLTPNRPAEGVALWARPAGNPLQIGMLPGHWGHVRGLTPDMSERDG